MTRVAVISAFALAAAATMQARDVVPFHVELRSQRCDDGYCWQRAIVGVDGSERYSLRLVPLYAVEGGVVAIELVLSRPGDEGQNLLARKFTEQPQVVTVEELVRGIRRSPFGARRSFELPPPDAGRIVFEILGWERGSGAGMCHSCPNIRAIDAVVTVDNE